MESNERDSDLNVQLAAMFTAWNFVERRHARISMPELALLFVSMDPFFVLRLIQISFDKLSKHAYVINICH